EGTWTPWQKVPVDVATTEDGRDSGAHLLPVVWHRRLYLFWPEFEQKSDTATIPALPDGFEGINCWHIKLAWSEYQDGRWLPKQVGTPYLVSEASTEHRSTPNIDVQRFGPDFVDVTTTTVDFGISLNPFNPVLPIGVSGNVTSSTKRETRKHVITEKEDTFLAGIELSAIGDSAFHVHSEVAFEFLSRLPAQAEHYLEAEIKGSVLLVRVNRRGLGVLHGKVRTVVQDTAVVVRSGERTDRKERAQDDKPAPPRANSDFSSVGTFRFQACLAEPQAFGGGSLGNYNSLQRPVATTNAFMGFRCSIGATTGVDPSFQLSASTTSILGFAPTTFGVIDSDNRGAFSSSSPFFYQDDQRCYLVTRTQHRHLERKVAAETQLDKRIGVEERATGLQSVVDRRLGLAPEAALRVNPWTRNSLVRWAGGPGLPTALRPEALLVMDQIAGSFTAKEGLTQGDKFFQPAEKVYPEYTFTPHWHPYTCPLIGSLNSGGLPGLFTLENQGLTDAKLMIVGVIGGPLTTFIANKFDSTYKPDRAQVVQPYPVEAVDFSPTGSYSQYNWELFFHAPMRIANALRREGRHEDALRWFHYVFDPMTPDADPSEKRAWRFLPFRGADTRSI